MILFNWKNKKSLDLSNAIAASAECKYGSETYAGIEINNQYFSFDNYSNLNFNSWLKIYCYESFSQQTFVYEKSLNIILNSAFDFQGITLTPLPLQKAR
jgi:hypothetical protein